MKMKTGKRGKAEQFYVSAQVGRVSQIMFSVFLFHIFGLLLAVSIADVRVPAGGLLFFVCWATVSIVAEYPVLLLFIPNKNKNRNTSLPVHLNPKHTGTQ